MTYIVAWKDEKNVYITGDSAITTTNRYKTKEEAEKANILNFEHSSFGEDSVEKKP